MDVRLKDELEVNDTDVEGWIKAEAKFLRNLKDELDERVLECMQALIAAEKAEYGFLCVIDYLLTYT